jgi:hypothetical protein
VLPALDVIVHRLAELRASNQVVEALPVNVGRFDHSA